MYGDTANVVVHTTCMPATPSPHLTTSSALLALDDRLASAQAAVDRAFELVDAGNTVAASHYTSRAKRACARVQREADNLPIAFGRVSARALALTAHAARITADALDLEKF